MRIGVDVMGGDNAPDEILKGAINVLPRLAEDDQLCLIGDRGVIADGLRERGVSDGRIEIVPTTEVIAMDESPVEAVRSKRDSSIVVMCQMASPKSDRRVDAIISAGNTGACVS